MRKGAQTPSHTFPGLDYILKDIGQIIGSAGSVQLSQSILDHMGVCHPLTADCDSCVECIRLQANKIWRLSTQTGFHNSLF